jgi:hypothetical protein
MAETAEQKAEREKKELEEKGAGAGAGAPAATATVPKDEKKPQLLNISALIRYSCPGCGETVNASEDDETDELELNEENNHRAELPADTGTCDFCKLPIARKKIVIAYL